MYYKPINEINIEAVRIRGICFPYPYSNLDALHPMVKNYSFDPRFLMRLAQRWTKAEKPRAAKIMQRLKKKYIDVISFLSEREL